MVLIDVDDCLTAPLVLGPIQGTNPHDDLDALAHLEDWN